MNNVKTKLYRVINNEGQEMDGDLTLREAGEMVTKNPQWDYEEQKEEVNPKKIKDSIWKYQTSSDIGSIKIFTDDFSCLYDNHYGDGDNIVCVSPNPINMLKEYPSATFSSSFTVRKNAYLSAHDCREEKIMRFSPGVYDVWLLRPMVFMIVKNST